MSALVGRRVARVVPYVVVLAIVVMLFAMTNRIDFVAPGGRIGPNFWPRAILILAMIACGYEIVKTLFFASGSAADDDMEGVLGTVLKRVPAPDDAVVRPVAGAGVSAAAGAGAASARTGEKDATLESSVATTAAAATGHSAGTAEPLLYPRLLWSGIALTVLYLFVVEKLGFFLTTALYLGLFMWIGRYRRLGVVVATSVLGALFFVFMFMKVVYVSLPLGVEPFAQVSYLLMKLLAIR